MSGLLPVAATANATEVDLLFFALLGITGLVMLTVSALIILFSIRYRRGSHADRSHRIKKSWHWEISWTTATFLAFLVLFGWGADLYARLYRPPDDSLEIFVVGQQWMWKVQHPDGQREINELHIPVDRAIRLIMTSQDVIHSFYVPAFRLKHDVLPGRYESLWFKPVEPGEYPLFCSEFCGTDHAAMIGRIVVMVPADYERWLGEQGPGDALAASGERLFRSLGCSGCHVGNGPVRAPDLAGIYGRQVQLADGRTVRVDERYIRDSILLPKSQTVAGYDPVMPSFAGQIDEGEILELIAYIKSLKPPRGSTR